MPPRPLLPRQCDIDMFCIMFGLGELSSDLRWGTEGRAKSMVDVLSKSTESLVQHPEVRQAVHTVLDRRDQPSVGQPLAVPVVINGKQVEVARVPSTQSESKGRPSRLAS